MSAESKSCVDLAASCSRAMQEISDMPQL
jgi:hypothetical protein